MTPFVFDTLGASKQLREAGMPEGMAEAVVSVFQHAATMPDISHLATKADLESLHVATKADMEALRLATRADLNALRSDLDALRTEMATKAELDTFRVETQAEFKMVRLEIKSSADAIRAEINDKFRQQTLAIIGGVAVMLTIATTAGRLFG